MVSDAWIYLILSLGLVWVSARVIGLLVEKVGWPRVTGEILSGVILGASVLGYLAPTVFTKLFELPVEIEAVHGVILQVCAGVFLFTAGLKMNLREVRANFSNSAFITLAGIAVPFFTALVLFKLGVLGDPADLAGRRALAHTNLVGLFLGIAFSISALPLLAKTLIDLKVYDSKVGVVSMTCAILSDLAGWALFAFLLSRSNFGEGHAPWLTVGSFAVGLFAAHSGILSSSGERVSQIANFVFAPLFFGSIALKVDVFTFFDWRVVTSILIAACISKVLGCGLTARSRGMNARDSWAIGFALNSRGAMEIILAMSAYQIGLISEQLLVALLIMALVTSMITGPILRKILARRENA